MTRKSLFAFLILVWALPFLGGCLQSPAQAREPDETLGQNIKDASLTAKIKTTYLFNPHLNSFRINVNTQDSAVTLEGVVKSGIQKDLAGEIAKNADGVRSVRNELRVAEGAVNDPDEVDRTFSQAVLDATTTASAKTALALTSDVRASDINVSTRWGTVTLTGVVKSRNEKRLAEETVRNTDGVKEVVNHLDVRG